MAKTTKAILAIFITMPIWYYLMYKILVGVNATELMWFLFIIYVTIGLFVSILNTLDAT